MAVAIPMVDHLMVRVPLLGIGHPYRVLALPLTFCFSISVVVGQITSTIRLTLSLFVA